MTGHAQLVGLAVHTIVGFALLWVAVMVVCSFGARR